MGFLLSPGPIFLDAAATTRLLQSPDGIVGRELTRAAIRVTTSAKGRCPVDTGRLRASITWQLGCDGTGLFVDVGSNVEYCIYVELGTRYAAAQPFLRPALAAI